MGELLRLAGVAPSDKKAAEAWLSDAIDLAQSMYRAVKQRLLPVDHNALLARTERISDKALKCVQSAPPSNLRNCK